jgi:hypothetical protein
MKMQIEPWREDKAIPKANQRRAKGKSAKKKMKKKHARRHRGEFVCDECWDERLRVTE